MICRDATPRLGGVRRTRLVARLLCCHARRPLPAEMRRFASQRVYRHRRLGGNHWLFATIKRCDTTQATVPLYLAVAASGIWQHHGRSGRAVVQRCNAPQFALISAELLTCIYLTNSLNCGRAGIMIHIVNWSRCPLERSAHPTQCRPALQVL